MLGPLSLALPFLAACSPTGEGVPVSEHLDAAFEDAASDFQVPRDLLVSVSYALTRLDDRGGEPSINGGVGLMDLDPDELATAAETLGLDIDTVAIDPVANIRGGAVILAGLAYRHERQTGQPVDTMQAWYPIVAEFSGATDPLVADGFADQVYHHMETGFGVLTQDGDWIEVAPRTFSWRQYSTFSGSALVTQYVPASSSNYTSANRGAGDITTVVIHTTQGSYSGAISWFQNPAAQASAHYVVRSSDGQITQMVDEKDIAWHAGDWTTNQHSIGIEHEGYVDQPDTWYTDAMYRSSAALVADICDRYGIPKDRNHIIGHYEVPGCSTGNGGGASCHTDPGSGWDWDYYMSLVNGSTSGGSLPPAAISDGDKTAYFGATVSSSRLGTSDTCSGTATGTYSGGQLYLRGTCTLDHHPDKTYPVTFTGSLQGGTTVVGKVVVDNYYEEYTATVDARGGFDTTFSGSQDVGGDVGTVSYDAELRLDP